MNGVFTALSQTEGVFPFEQGTKVIRIKHSHHLLFCLTENQQNSKMFVISLKSICYQFDLPKQTDFDFLASYF